MRKTRVVVADDHPVMRSGIRRLLDAEPDIEVVGEAASGTEALKLVETLGPDVLLLDMEMPEMSGVEVARRLREARSPVLILAFSAYDDPSYISGLLASGAAGYITKEKSPTVIAEAVRAVFRGEGRWLVRPVLPSRPDLPISEREQEVLRLMARGASNHEIAGRLHISEHTVRNHVASIYAKLEVKTWREAVAWAWEHGIMQKR